MGTLKKQFSLNSPFSVYPATLSDSLPSFAAANYLSGKGLCAMDTAMDTVTDAGVPCRFGVPIYLLSKATNCRKLLKTGWTRSSNPREMTADETRNTQAELDKTEAEIQTARSLYSIKKQAATDTKAIKAQVAQIGGQLNARHDTADNKMDTIIGKLDHIIVGRSGSEAAGSEAASSIVVPNEQPTKEKPANKEKPATKMKMEPIAKKAKTDTSVSPVSPVSLPSSASSSSNVDGLHLETSIDDELEVAKKEYQETLAVNLKTQEEKKMECDRQAAEKIDKSLKDAMKKHNDRCHQYEKTKQLQLQRSMQAKAKDDEDARIAFEEKSESIKQRRLEEAPEKAETSEEESEEAPIIEEPQIKKRRQQEGPGQDETIEEEEGPSGKRHRNMDSLKKAKAIDDIERRAWMARKAQFKESGVLQQPDLTFAEWMIERDRCKQHKQDPFFRSKYFLFNIAFFCNTNRLFDHVTQQLHTAITGQRRPLQMATIFLLRMAGSPREEEKPGFSGAAAIVKHLKGNASEYVKSMPFTGRKHTGLC